MIRIYNKGIVQEWDGGKEENEDKVVRDWETETEKVKEREREWERKDIRSIRGI